MFLIYASFRGNRCNMVEDNKVVYKWFKKEMSNYLLLLANSAMPFRRKRECLVQPAAPLGGGRQHAE